MMARLVFLLVTASSIAYSTGEYVRMMFYLTWQGLCCLTFLGTPMLQLVCILTCSDSFEGSAQSSDSMGACLLSLHFWSSARHHLCYPSTQSQLQLMQQCSTCYWIAAAKVDLPRSYSWSRTARSNPLLWCGPSLVFAPLWLFWTCFATFPCLLCRKLGVLIQCYLKAFCQSLQFDS